MAANKKKKKTPNNPARGFATTSIASRKVQSTDNNDGDSREVAPSTTPPSEGQGQRAHTEAQISVGSSSKEVSDLCAEELEAHLETSDLQRILDEHGDRCNRDASRQVIKLKTERRLLRPQAAPFDARFWVPDEITELILRRVASEREERISLLGHELQTGATPDSSEDVSLIRLWTLQRTLLALGFPRELARRSMRSLLEDDLYAHRNVSFVTKDSIWGLENCLDWLALSCDANNLPNYESALQESEPMKASKRRHWSMAVATVGPSRNEALSTAVEKPTLDGEAQLRTAIKSPFPRKEASPESSATDSDEDLDPDQLINHYLSLKSRLYELDPNLDLPIAKHTKSKSRTGSKELNTPSAAVREILQKLRRIQSDVLFDLVEAEGRWMETWKLLARQAAQRRRYGIGNEIPKLGSSEGLSPAAIVPSRNSIPGEKENSVEEAVGNFFSSLPHTSADTNGICSIKDVTSDTNLIVRDFGEFTGISPRRVFEEACRARDASCRIAYKLVAATSFSKRHSIFVEWSRKQDTILFPPLSTVSFELCDHSMMIEMATISAPSVAQSEGYVSTVALYSVFASSSKEEKTYLRLPFVWRDLFLEFRASQKEIVDSNDRRELRELRQMVESYEPEYAGANSESTGQSASGKKPEFITRRPELQSYNNEHLSDPGTLAVMWADKVSTSTYKQMKETRMRLPVWSYREMILSAIESHQVVIICGETGCGKSTQIPAYFLEHELSSNRSCVIYCTEPRRIAAISLARRVSEELGEQKGLVGTSRSIVGYTIRLESRISSTSRLVYATTGILLRMLEGATGLEGITHLVLDEIHERSIDSDFLLIVLRKVLVRRPTLKVLLMSATVDAQRFSDYFSRAPIMNIPGRTFPVATKYLEDVVEMTSYGSRLSGSRRYSDGLVDDNGDDDTNDDNIEHSTMPDAVVNLKSYSMKTRHYLANFDEMHINFDLIVKLLEKLALDDAYIRYSTAILVFLPGLAEIRRLNDTLASRPLFSQNWIIHTLHSAVASEEQERAFAIPPKGTRKIILATNIAETGVTIPDVTCVIDTGKHKEMRFDERRQLSRLIETFISRANAKQRRGRAGRVQDGLCFHLYTRYRHDHLMPEQQTPEMLRLSLQDLVLRVKICKLGLVDEVLSEALDPPSSKNIRRAIDSLINVKALTTSEDLTSLGRQLAKLPLDVFLGKLILVGSLCRCLDVTLTIAAMLSSKSPFFAPTGSRSRANVARLAFKKGHSDLMTDYSAYDAWRRIRDHNKSIEYQFCQKNFLSQQTLSGIEDLKAQLTMSLVDAGFIQLDKAELASLASARTYSRRRPCITTPDRYNVNTRNETVVTAIIGWSFYPKILSRDGKGWRNIANNQVVSLSPTSVNKGIGSPLKWLAFHHIMQSNNKSYNAFETTSLDDFAILFCGEADFKLYSGVVVIDGNRIRLRFDDWRTMFAIKTLRARIRQIVDQSFRNPGFALTPQQHAWLDTWQDVCSRGVTGSTREGNPVFLVNNGMHQKASSLYLASTIVSSTTSYTPPNPNRERVFSQADRVPKPEMPDWCLVHSIPTVVVDRLSGFMPPSSLLVLRLVCSTTKLWVDQRKPSLFSSLQLNYPLVASHSSYDILYQLALDCHKLTIKISSRSSPSSLTLPPLPCLKCLQILAAPSTSPVSSIMLSLRLTLQQALLPRLIEVVLQNISISDVLALRWGPFSSFIESTRTSAEMWHGIKSLDISMKLWWESALEETETQSRAQKRVERDARRVGIKVLHDWLASFAGTLEKLVFEWMETTGPNPLLLDIFSTEDRRGKWFSAPEINWKVLRELRLGGCPLLGKDVPIVKDRAIHLAKLVSQQHMVETGIQGVQCLIGGEAWFSISLGIRGDQNLALVPSRGTEMEELFQVTTAQAIVEYEEGDNDDGSGSEAVLSEDSMEVPFYLDIR